MPSLFAKLKLGMLKSSRVTLAGASHQGKLRDHNEDAFGIDPKRGVAIVADGVGGLDGGEVASRITVDSVLSAVGQGQSISDGIQLAHGKIIASADTKSGTHMASTAVAIAIGDRKVVVAWLGDSRAYLWRESQLEQLTKDHSFVQQLLDFGAIAPAEAEQHPNRNIVTRTVGQRDADVVEIDQLQVPIRDGDRLLLCTDGLSGYLTTEQISEELRTGGSDQTVAQRLIDRTLKDSDAGDNVTVICASVSFRR